MKKYKYIFYHFGNGILPDGYQTVYANSDEQAWRIIANCSIFATKRANHKFELRERIKL